MNRGIMWAVIAFTVYIAGVVGFLLVSVSYREDPRYLTADTITHFTLKHFDRADTIVDGTLLLDEFCDRVAAAQTDMSDPCRRRFGTVDTDRDDRITSKEMVDFYLNRLRAADQNQDGRVTEEEWLAAMQVN